MGAFARCVSGLRAVCRGLLLVSPAAIWQALSSGPSSGIHLLGLTWRAHLATGKRCLLPVVDIWEVTPVSKYATSVEQACRLGFCSPAWRSPWNG